MFEIDKLNSKYLNQNVYTVAEVQRYNEAASLMLNTSFKFKCIQI